MSRVSKEKWAAREGDGTVMATAGVEDARSGAAGTGDFAAGRSGLVECLGRRRAEALFPVIDRYPFKASRYYLSLCDFGDPDDPMARQCLPDVRELDVGTGGAEDPFTERAHSPLRGVVHRFRDRVLIVATSECAVYCRHCTRKNTLRDLSLEGDWAACERVVGYVRHHPEVREVIVSGGDPLLLARDFLKRLLSTLSAIPSVEVLRIGTRVPVVLPSHLDDTLCDLLAAHRPLWVNTQFNHPAELTSESRAACERLTRRGIPVSNQSVLLKGVNASLEVMRELCNALQRNMIRPYYAFHCDPVRGTRHFWTDVDTGTRIAEGLRTSVGGLSLPRFVVDLPEEAGKLPLTQWKYPPGAGEGG